MCIKWLQYVNPIARRNHWRIRGTVVSQRHVIPQAWINVKISDRVFWKAEHSLFSTRHWSMSKDFSSNSGNWLTFKNWMACVPGNRKYQAGWQFKVGLLNERLVWVIGMQGQKRSNSNRGWFAYTEKNHIDQLGISDSRWSNGLSRVTLLVQLSISVVPLSYLYSAQGYSLSSIVIF